MASLIEKIFRAMDARRRRREEREREFVAANAGWSAPAAAPAPGARKSSVAIDREGLQSAFLDRSGRIAYYLDTESGEVVESGEAMPEPRFRRVPSRPAAADEEERRAFVELLDPSATREKLRAARNAAEFRAALSEDRTVERRWYVFRNDRASAAVETWLGTL